MKIITPRNNFALDYTPKQWVGFMNTCLLLFVTFMFGLVVYNMRSIDQQLVSVLDSSVVAINLLTTDLLHSQSNPYWRTVGQDLSVYSAFYKDRGDDERGSVLIVGSSPLTKSTEDLRCLLEYEDEDDVNIAFVDYRRISNCSQTMFLFCHAKIGAVPKKVALVSYTNNIPKQWMDVKKIQTISNNRTFEDGSQTKMAACVRPLEGSETVKDVAEFVAFYETVGVDHIYFYDRSARPEVVDFILQLEGMGHSVNHLPWNRNDEPSDCPVVWSEFVQDCIHRGLDKYSDIVTVGVSEFVVPMDYFRLPTMMEQIRLSNQNASQFRMKSANFCEDPSASMELNLNDYPSANRDINIISFGKMTVRGELKSSNSNYFIHLNPEMVLGFRDQISEVTLPGSEVSVHLHSKQCDSTGILDFSAFKYSHIVDQSDVMKLYRRTSNGIENQVTPSPV